MPTFIELTKIISDRTVRDHYSDTDEPGENENRHECSLKTTRISVNVASIRSFYPRRDNRPGTRLQFTDGGGHAVTEPYEHVQAMIGRPL